MVAPIGAAVKPYNVLILCTGNSARSILAEAYLGSAGRGRFKAFSAGSHPAGKVNPFAIELLQANGLDTTGLHSKNWDEFAKSGAPNVDVVITVCDNAAGEVCPIWPGRPVKAHWGIADPAAAQGSDDEKRKAFRQAFSELKNRIDALVALPLEEMSPASLKAALDAIGRKSGQG